MSAIMSALLLGSALFGADQPAALCGAPDGRGERIATVRLETVPALRIIRSSPPISAPGEVWRAPDGLFYVDATVNGASVRFLVDTGATTVVLTPEDARRAGILPEAAHFSAKADTANGGTAMAWVTLDHVDVAGTSAQGLRAAVAGTGLGVSLLGQSWLSQLDSVTIEGDRMTLR